MGLALALFLGACNDARTPGSGATASTSAKEERTEARRKGGGSAAATPGAEPIAKAGKADDLTSAPEEREPVAPDATAGDLDGAAPAANVDPVDGAGPGAEEAAPGGACVVERRELLADKLDRKADRAAVAPRKDGGVLVAFPTALDEVGLVRIDRRGNRGPTALVNLPGGRYLWGLYAEAHGALLMTHTLCTDGRFHHKCIYVQPLDEEGKPEGSVFEDRTKEWVGARVLHQDGSRIYMMRQTMYIPSELARLDVAADGTVEKSVLRVFDAGDALPPRPMAFATRGDEWYLVLGEEDPESDGVLMRFTSSRQERLVPLRLPREAIVTAFEVGERTISMIIAPGRGRPKQLELALDGRVTSAPRTVPRGEKPAAPFAEGLRFGLESNGDRVVFVRRDATGTRIGEVTSLGEGKSVGEGFVRTVTEGNLSGGSVVRVGERYVAAHVERKGKARSVVVSTLSCR